MVTTPPAGRGGARLPRPFWLLLAGQTVSGLGSQITIVAVPLIAIEHFGASNLAVGMLAAVSFLPYALIGLHAGAIADRAEMRTMMIWTDAGRAALLGLVPLLWAVDALSLPLLFVVVFVVGVLTVFFEVCHSAYVPRVVGREQLLAGNSHLQLSHSGTQVAGPTLAGWLVDVFSGPAAIFVDAFTFVVSALFLRPLPPVERVQGAKRSLRSDIRDGLVFVRRHAILRSALLTFGSSVVFITMYQAALVVFLRRGLGLPPGQLGVLLAIGNLGFVIGALANGWLRTKLRLGQSFLLGLALLGTGFLVVGLSPRSHDVALVQVGLGQLVASMGTPITSVAMVTLRQLHSPPDLQARVNSVFRILGRGTMPAGAALGAVIAQAASPRAALLVAGVGGVLAVPVAGGKLWRATADAPPAQEAVTVVA